VHSCGYAAAASFGASSWLIVRPGRGNVLIDSPRAAAPLLERIEALGGVALMLLTHGDDVADHRRFRERFGCERVMHEADIDDDTADVERKLTGREPVALDDDLLVVPVPGHTAGSIALLHRDEFLFTGDHLWGEGDRLGASRSVCWSSWTEQTRSMERLLERRFTWVLPGHGGRFHAGSPDAMRRELEGLIARMRRAA
jgi:glyoxylase-like metal-dependent hydrolase (beta-lactamase superfamily II)